jgi:leader peptidase (prepilin peptidase) / N-methyltransferase
VSLALFPPWFLYAVFAAFGLVMGSFGNVLIARLPAEKSIGGRSKCPRCGRMIRLYENIPVLSFVMLGGKCAGCKKPISWQYPLVEIGSALLFVLAYSLFPDDLLSSALTAIGLWALLLIMAIDAQTQSIPDVLTLILAVVGLILHWHLGDIPILAPLLGAGFFGVQWALSRGKWVGSGDILLAAAMGFFLGSWPLLLVALMLAYIIGAIIVTTLLMQRKAKAGQSIAFGPFFVLGTVVAFVWGELLLTIFLQKY